MENRLSRKRARQSVVLFFAGACIMFGAYAMLSAGVLHTLGALIGLMAVGYVCIMVSAGLAKERCPFCGEFPGGRLPRWKEPWGGYCSHCGKRLRYDDEPEGL